MGADSLMGNPVPAGNLTLQLAISPFSWVDAAMEGVGVRVGQMMETEAAREPEEEGTRKKSMSLEDLRKRYS